MNSVEKAERGSTMGAQKRDVGVGEREDAIERGKKGKRRARASASARCG